MQHLAHETLTFSISEKRFCGTLISIYRRLNSDDLRRVPAARFLPNARDNLCVRDIDTDTDTRDYKSGQQR